MVVPGFEDRGRFLVGCLVVGCPFLKMYLPFWCDGSGDTELSVSVSVSEIPLSDKR